MKTKTNVGLERVEMGEHIVADPQICHGKPTFKGTRIMVFQVLKQVAYGTPWDRDFWKRELCLARYCRVFLDILEHEGDIAAAVRRLLRHPAFNTHAKRMGKVVRIHPGGVQYRQLGQQALQAVRWV
jgi:hypothetical protein